MRIYCIYYVVRTYKSWMFSQSSLYYSAELSLTGCYTGVFMYMSKLCQLNSSNAIMCSLRALWQMGSPE